MSEPYRLPRTDLSSSDLAGIAGWQPRKKSDGSKTADVRCPGCLRIGSLDDHEIRLDGRVTESLDCPHFSCRFHENVILEGWSA